MDKPTANHSLCWEPSRRWHRLAGILLSPILLAAALSVGRRSHAKPHAAICGGFNICANGGGAEGHEAVARSDRRRAIAALGETPVVFVARRPSGQAAAARSLRFSDELPRSAICKVLKRDLRDAYAAGR